MMHKYYSLMMSSKPAPHNSAPAMASSNAVLPSPLGTAVETNLRRLSAKRHVSKTYPVDTAIQGTRPIVTNFSSRTDDYFTTIA